MAFCQFEVLRRCPPARILQALEELPESLDGTYERILPLTEELSGLDERTSTAIANVATQSQDVFKSPHYQGAVPKKNTGQAHDKGPGGISSTSTTASRGHEPLRPRGDTRHEPLTEEPSRLYERASTTGLDPSAVFSTLVGLGTLALASRISSTSVAGRDRRNAGDSSLPFTIPFIHSEGFLMKMFGRQDAEIFIESL